MNSTQICSGQVVGDNGVVSTRYDLAMLLAECRLHDVCDHLQQLETRLEIGSKSPCLFSTDKTSVVGTRA